MSMNALRIPVDGDPEVVQHSSWTNEAVHAALEADNVLAVGLNWRPRPRHWLLLLAGAAGGAPNKAAYALGGQRAVHLCGPLLVLGMSERTGYVAGLDERELLAICTHLLVGEFRRSVAAKRGPHRITAGTGLQSIPTEGTT